MKRYIHNSIDFDQMKIQQIIDQSDGTKQRKELLSQIDWQVSPEDAKLFISNQKREIDGKVLYFDTIRLPVNDPIIRIEYYGGQYKPDTYWRKILNEFVFTYESGRKSLFGLIQQWGELENHPGVKYDNLFEVIFKYLGKA